LDVIQAGWTRQAVLTKFSQVKERVKAIIGAADLDIVSETLDKHYQRLESCCTEWLKEVTLDQRWMNPDDYCVACKTKGYKVEINVWR
jgi:hypothetical protein